MQGPSWIALFERIPPKLHDTLALTLVTGAEIIMQSLLRLESDFAILRGRMAGSTDAGRVIVLPYHQIVNLAFMKRMLEPEVEAIFGNILQGSGDKGGGHASTADEGAAETAGTAEDRPEAANAGADGQAANAQDNRTPLVPATDPGKNQPRPPSKSILLARLRARLAEQGKQ
jgi:hypothetical protein